MRFERILVCWYFSIAFVNKLCFDWNTLSFKQLIHSQNFIKQ